MKPGGFYTFDIFAIKILLQFLIRFLPPFHQQSHSRFSPTSSTSTLHKSARPYRSTASRIPLFHPPALPVLPVLPTTPALPVQLGQSSQQAPPAHLARRSSHNAEKACTFTRPDFFRISAQRVSVPCALPFSSAAAVQTCARLLLAFYRGSLPCASVCSARAAV